MRMSARANPPTSPQFALPPPGPAHCLDITLPGTRWSWGSGRDGCPPPAPSPRKKKPSLSIPGAEVANIDDGDDWWWWCPLPQIFLRFFFSPMPPTGDQLQEIPEERYIDNKRCYISECRHFLGHPALSLTLCSIKGVCPICETVELSPYLLSKWSVEGVGKGSDHVVISMVMIFWNQAGQSGTHRGIGHLGVKPCAWSEVV